MKAIIIVTAVLMSVAISLSAQTIGKAWGKGLFGAIGDGYNVNRALPVLVYNTIDAVEVSAGDDFTVYILANGSMWSVGRNDAFQLGNGTNIDTHTPGLVVGDSSWRSVACGGGHSLALKKDGSLWAWGNNASGQIGDGTTMNRSVPIRIGVDNDWIYVGAGVNHSMAIKSDGSLYMWGANLQGQIGNGTTEAVHTPTQVGSSIAWSKVVGGLAHTVGMARSGQVYVWGSNAEYQIGLPGSGGTLEPTQAYGLGSASDIAAGRFFTLAVVGSPSGLLYGCGSNNEGQMGDLFVMPHMTFDTITNVGGWKKVAAGGGHCAAFDSRGQLFTWGWNAFGQIGNADFRNVGRPFPVDKPGAWTRVACGLGHTAAISTNDFRISLTMPSNIQLCLGDSVELKAKVGGGFGKLSFKWTPDTLMQWSDSVVARVWPTVHTRYTLTVTDDLGTVVNGSVIVYVREMPEITAGADTVICPGQKVMLSGRAKGGNVNARYSWSPASSLEKSQVLNPIAFPKTTTRYILTARSENGCEVRDTVMVYVNTPPDIKLSRTLLVYPVSVDCDAEQYADTIVTIENKSDFDVMILPPAEHDIFSVVDPPLPYSISAGESLKVVVRCTPKDLTTYKYDMLIPMEARGCVSTVKLQLRATHTSPRVEVSAARIDFPPVIGCDRFRDTLVRVNNRGTTNIYVDANLSSSSFRVLNKLPLMVPPGRSLDVRVRFQPVEQGTSTATLRVMSQPCDMPFEIPLEGTKYGIGFAIADTVDLGFIPRCATEPVFVPVTLKNISDAEVTGSVTNMKLSDGLRTTLPMGQIVLTNQTINFGVGYVPRAGDTVGEHHGTLQLWLSPCTLTETIAVKYTLVDPVAKVDSVVDFGVRAAGSITELVRSVVNTSQIPLRIDSLTGFDDTFVLTTTFPALPVVLQPGDSLQYQVMYRAADQESRTVVDVAFGSPCLFSGSIVFIGSGVDTPIYSLQAYDTSDSACVGVPRSVGVRLKNTGNRDIQLDGYTIVPSAGITADILNFAPSVLPPGAERTFLCEYTAAAPGDIRFAVRWQSPNISTSANIDVAVSDCAVPDTVRATVALNRLILKAGEKDSILLLLTEKNNIDLPGAPRNFTAVISYNRSVVFIPDGQVDCLREECRMTVQGVYQGSDTLLSIPMVATLGMTDRSELRFESFRWTDAVLTTETNTVDGSVQINGICEEGALRLYVASDFGYSLAVRPNPADSRVMVEFGLAEPATVRIELISVTGNRIGYVLPPTAYSEGHYAVWYDVSTLPSGVYYVVLQTDNARIQQRLDVVR